MFSQLEKTRAELETKVGMESLLQAYQLIQVLQKLVMEMVGLSFSAHVLAKFKILGNVGLDFTQTTSVN